MDILLRSDGDAVPIYDTVGKRTDSGSSVSAEIIEPVVVRHANIKDFSGISALIQESKKEVSPGLTWERNKIISTLENPDGRVIALAVYGGLPVGFAAAEVCGKIWMEQDELYYAFNYVAPPYRRRGIANSLSSLITGYGKGLRMKRIVSEPVTMAGRNRAEMGGFELIRTEDYFAEKPSKVIKGKDGVDSYIYYIGELPLTVPDKIAVMYL